MSDLERDSMLRKIRDSMLRKIDEDNQQRIERYKLGLANAIARLANSHRPDWIAYNKRQIAKYQKLLSALTNEETVINLVNLRAVAADVRYRLDAQSADAIAYAADEIERLRAAIRATEGAYMRNDPKARLRAWNHMIALTNEQEGENDSTTLC